MAFDIKAYNSINFLNELEQFINDFDKIDDYIVIDNNLEEVADGSKMDNKNLNDNLQEEIKLNCKIERFIKIDEKIDIDLRKCNSVKEKKNEIINDLAKCLYCLCYAIIEGDCNFITCDSVKCEGKKFFCKVCNKKITSFRKDKSFS